jgi:hypothetical protein
MELAAEITTPLVAGIRRRLGELSPLEARVAQTLLDQGADRLI